MQTDILLEPNRSFRVKGSLDCANITIIELEMLDSPLLTFSWEQPNEQNQRNTPRRKKTTDVPPWAKTEE